MRKTASSERQGHPSNVPQITKEQILAMNVGDSIFTRSGSWTVKSKPKITDKGIEVILLPPGLIGKLALRKVYWEDQLFKNAEGEIPSELNFRFRGFMSI